MAGGRCVIAEIAIAALVAAAVSAASYTINYLLTPKPKPVERGRLQGDLQVQNSEYGGMIPLILGGAGALAASSAPPFVAERRNYAFAAGSGGNPPMGQINPPAGVAAGDYLLAQTTVDDGASCPPATPPGWEKLDEQILPYTAGAGGVLVLTLFGKFYDAGDVVPYDFYPASSPTTMDVVVSAWRRVNVSSPVNDVSGHAFETGGGGATEIPLPSIDTTVDGCRLVALGEWRAADVGVPAGYTAHLDNSDTSISSKTQASAGATGAVAVSLTGTTTNDIGGGFLVALRPAAADAGEGEVSTDEGGARVAGNVIYLSDVRKTETTTESGGKGGGGQKTVTIEYFVDFAVMFGEGELDLLALFADSDVLFDGRAGAARTGLRDAAFDPDADYDPEAPPDPEDATISGSSASRYNGSGLFSGVAQEIFEATSGMTGGELDFRFYAGTETQDVDPLLEAAMGAGSTPAYLGRSYVVFENFNVSKYGRIPNITAILSNRNLKTCGQIITALAERVDYDTSDLDTSDVDSIAVRGLPVAERTPPRAIAEILGDAYAFDVVESGGAVACIARGGASSFTVAAADLGCVESDGGGDGDVWSQFDTALQLDETDLPRRVDVRAADPARDNEQNAQGVTRVSAQTQKHETYEYALTLTAEEMRRLAARKMAEAWKDGRQTCRFALPYTYHDVRPGRVGTVTRPDGTSHRVRVTEVNGFIPGVLDVSAKVERNNLAGGASGGSADPYAQTQIVAGSSASGTSPGVGAARVPATSVFGAVDRMLRAEERHDGVGGFYAAAASFGNGEWAGATLYRDRGTGFEPYVRFAERATMGVAVSVLAGTDLGAETVDVDIYGDMTPATSATDDEIAAGKCAVISGDEIFQYKTATQIGGGVNRWRFSDLRNRGKLCSTAAMATHATGERFLVLNSALRFCPVEPELKGEAVDYRMVTTGANVSDAATCEFTAALPDFDVTTPADFQMTSPAGGEILATWTPVAASACKVADGVVYEIRLTTTGGTLLFEGNASEYRRTNLAPATYAWHFRAKTKYDEGAWISDSVAVTSGAGLTVEEADDGRAVAQTGVTELELRGGRVSAPAAGRAQISVNKYRSTVEFVGQMYAAALATDPTTPQLAAALALLDGATSDADFIAQASAVALSVYTGAAYLALATTDAQFVTHLYEGIFNRAPDAVGLAYWVGQLAGMTRADMTDAFVRSVEGRTDILLFIRGWNPAAGAELAAQTTRELVFEFGDGVNAGNIGVGLTRRWPKLLWPGRVVGWRMVGESGVSGSATVELRRSTYAGYTAGPATVCGATPPVISADDQAEGTPGVDWSPALSEGDVLVAVLTAVSTHKQITLEVTVDISSSGRLLTESGEFLTAEDGTRILF